MAKFLRKHHKQYFGSVNVERFIKDYNLLDEDKIAERYNMEEVNELFPILLEQKRLTKVPLRKRKYWIEEAPKERGIITKLTDAYLSQAPVKHICSSLHLSVTRWERLINLLKVTGLINVSRVYKTETTLFNGKEVKHRVVYFEPYIRK